MGMERVLITLEALGVELPVEAACTDAFIVTLGDEKRVRPIAVSLLAELRRAGLAADMDYKSRKFGPQIKRADDLGARFALILGDSEAERGIVQLRDQSTKEQREVPLPDVVDVLRAAIGPRKSP
jgi:histidyl-tRNA synthetase